MRFVQRRRGISAIELLVVLAILGLLAGFLVVAVFKARAGAGRIESVNNLRQIALACHTYADANNSGFPSGIDQNDFSTLAHLLPYLEQEQAYKLIDFKKHLDDKANDKARQAVVKVFLSPLDPQKTVRDDRGATNYLFCAGSKPGLKDNDGLFCAKAGPNLGQITAADGTSNTLLAAETLKGDGGTRAVDVRRQHVLFKAEKPKEQPPVKVDAEQVKKLLADLTSAQFAVRQKAVDGLEKLGDAIEADLKKALEGKPNLDVSKRIDELLQKIDKRRRDRLEVALTGLKEDSGTQDWKDDKNILGDRCSSWLDGRFLQGTFSANRPFNDTRPDVNAGGRGGYSPLRNLGTPVIATAFADGHVQNIPVNVKLDVWKALATWNGGEAVTPP